MKQVIKNHANDFITVNEIQPNKYFAARLKCELSFWNLRILVLSFAHLTH